MKIEQTILNNLIHNEDYIRKVGPHISEEFFHDKTEKAIFQEIASFFKEYNKQIPLDALYIELDKRDDLSERELTETYDLIDTQLKDKKETNDAWLFKETEQFCKDKAVYNAIMESIQIIQGEHKTLTDGAITKLLEDALSISFNTKIGHDYLENALERFEFYNRKEEKIPFDIDYLNKITNGGMSKKTLNVVLGGTNTGKSLIMCHIAATALQHSKNVLYITMEMAEEKIAARIDANLMNIPLDDVWVLPKDDFNRRIDRIKQKAQGKLIIKEYPTSQAHVGHFRALLNELKMKRDFIPDLVVIDYINICASSRLKGAASVNSYTLIKSIAEEMRGLAVENEVPILTGTQTNRTGYSDSDVDLTGTAESFGLPATADLMFAVISSEELEQLGQYMFKQLKNRDGDVTKHRKFVVGVDRPRMKLYNVEQSAQNISKDGSEDIPVFDRSESGEKFKLERAFSELQF